MTIDSGIRDRRLTRIEVPFPDGEELELTIAVGGCRLDVHPGDGPAWVSGTYDDPTEHRPCKIVREGRTVRITQETRLRGRWKRPSGPPTFELGLGKERPYRLTVESGAGEVRLDLGGLPLTELALRNNAGRSEIDFSAPNPASMGRLSLETSAGGLELRNLANAGFARLDLQGRAGGYVLDFGGMLPHSAEATIRAGIGSVEVRVPATTAARIVLHSTMGGLERDGAFVERDGAFWTPDGLDTAEPLLSIRVDLTMGSLSLRAT